MVFLKLQAYLDGYAPLVAAAVVAVLFLAWQQSGPKLDPREPPYVRSSIPIVGSLIGLFRYQKEFYTILRYNTPISHFFIALNIFQ
jgi:hypothetical protein